MPFAILAVLALIAGDLKVAPTPEAWAKGPGGTAAGFLNLEGDARAGALGGAFSGLVAGEPAALGWNPAGLGGFHGQAVQFTHLQWLGDVTYDAAAYARALGRDGGLGARAVYLQSGEITRTNEDAATGTFGQESGSFRNSGMAVALGYGHRLGERWRVGAAVKYVGDAVAGDAKSAVAADVGVHRTFGGRAGPGVGVSVQNLGTNVGGDPLPLIVRGGVGVGLLAGRPLTVLGEAGYAIRSGRLTAGAGAEYWIKDRVAPRVGYRYAESADLDRGVTAGVGLRFKGWTLDYAFATTRQEFAPAHRVSLGLKF